MPETCTDVIFQYTKTKQFIELVFIHIVRSVFGAWVLGLCPSWFETFPLGNLHSRKNAVGK
jgi:hypothetical protein